MAGSCSFARMQQRALIHYFLGVAKLAVVDGIMIRNRLTYTIFHPFSSQNFLYTCMLNIDGICKTSMVYAIHRWYMHVHRRYMLNITVLCYTSMVYAIHWWYMHIHWRYMLNITVLCYTSTVYAIHRRYMLNIDSICWTSTVYSEHRWYMLNIDGICKTSTVYAIHRWYMLYMYIDGIC